MPSIIIPGKSIRQVPGFAALTSQARSLGVVYAHGLGTSPLHDAASQTAITTANVSYEQTTFGVAPRFNGTSSTAVAGFLGSPYQTLSVLLWMNVSTWASPGSYNILAEYSADGFGTAGGAVIYYSGTNSNSDRLNYGGKDSSVNYGRGVAAFTAGRWTKVHFWLDFTKTSIPDKTGLEIDGLYQTPPESAASITTTQYFLDSSWQFFHRFGPSLFTPGMLGPVVMFKRRLSTAEANGYLANPFQLAAGGRSRLYFAVPAAGGGAYSITGSAGTTTFAGASATLKLDRKVVASAGAVTVSGASATIKYDRKIVAAAGSVSIAGSSATLKLGRKVVASAGTTTFAGATATVTYQPAGAYTITASPRAVTLAGATATVTYTPHNNYTLTASARAVTLAGATATVTYAPINHYTLTALGGSVVMAGSTATLRWSGEATPVAQITPAGSPGKSVKQSKKRRTLVDIDGKLVEVRGVREVQALIKKLRQEAKVEAPKLAKKALNKARDIEREDGELPEIEIEAPEIEVVEGSDWVKGEFEALHEAIERDYERAVQAEQIALLARRKYFEDDEEDALLALMAA